MFKIYVRKTIKCPERQKEKKKRGKTYCFWIIKLNS